MPSPDLVGPVLAQAPTLETVATPALWAGTIGAVVLLLVLDFIVTRKPHEVSMKEAIGWSAFYIALPLAFGGPGGELRAIKIGGRGQWRIERDELEAFIQRMYAETEAQLKSQLKSQAKGQSRTTDRSKAQG